MTNRTAYRSVSVLGDGAVRPNDGWETGLNCNELVLGPSGAGKTRGFLMPNLVYGNQEASFLVLDTKGTLHDECGPTLRERGYDVQRISFAEVGGTIGWDPLDHVRMKGDKPSQQDVLAVAAAVSPRGALATDPFWDLAAANYLSAIMAYVVEAFPDELRTTSRVVRLFEECTAPGAMDALFAAWAQEAPEGLAARAWRRSRITQDSEKTHASIMGVLAQKLACLAFDEATALFDMREHVDFARLGHDRVALFVTVSDVDRSLDPLVSLFVTQALQGLMREADRCEGGRLPRPVRLFLDDFSNLRVPDFDKVLAVTRSREIWVTMLCQSASQLDGLYGHMGAEAILGNCDTQLVLAFQDSTTASAYAARAGRTPDSLMHTPTGRHWLFVRGRKPQLVHAFDEAALLNGRTSTRGVDASARETAPAREKYAGPRVDVPLP